MEEIGSPFLDKAFCEQVVPIDDISERTGTVTAGEGGTEIVSDNNARTLDGYSASDFSLISHSHQMSHPYSVIGEVDDRDSFIFYFNTDGLTPVVRMAIRGIGYPARHFVDLPSHTHDSSKTVPAAAHTHPLDGAFSGTTGGNSPLHTHQYVAGNVGTYNTATDSLGHTHDISGSTSGTSGVPSGTQSVGGGSAGVSGGTLAATKKQYANALTIWFDGVNVTAKFLTATGWAAIGDGTGSHAFHTAGTGVIDVSAFITWDSGVHSVEVREPTTDRGCRISLFIDTLYSVDPHAILLGTDADTQDGKHGSEYATVAASEPKITKGATSQYFRGDMSLRHLPVYGLCPEDYGAAGDFTTDDTASVQACVTACLADQDRPIPMICTGRYRLTGHVHIDRSHHANTGGGDDVTYGLFRIIGMGKSAGFYVDSNIYMFSTTLRWINPPYANPDEWPVSGGVSFEGIQFEADDATRTAYVIDGLHLGLHLWFTNRCHFTKMKLVNSTNYLQTVYIYDCVMRYWSGSWWTSVDALDVNFRGNLCEFGGDLFNISNGTYSGLAGFRFIDNDVENSGAVLLANGCTGVRFEGNYMEANSPTTWVTFGNSNGVVHTGNRYYDPRTLGAYHTFGTKTKVLDDYNFQL